MAFRIDVGEWGLVAVYVNFRSVKKLFVNMARRISVQAGRRVGVTVRTGNAARESVRAKAEGWSNCQNGQRGKGNLCRQGQRVGVIARMGSAARESVQARRRICAISMAVP